jgi:hypothetical protein
MRSLLFYPSAGSVCRRVGALDPSKEGVPNAITNVGAAVVANVGTNAEANAETWQAVRKASRSSVRPQSISTGLASGLAFEVASNALRFRSLDIACEVIGIR